MDGMEEKLNSILGNPQMMQQIMSMAQALGAGNPEPARDERPKPGPEWTSPPPPPSPGIDPAILQKIMGVAQKSGVDRNQQALLRALQPYLSRERIAKLEKAMRSAKLAALASSFLGSDGLSLFSGR